MIFRCKLYETAYLLEMNSSLFNNLSNVIDLAICCLWSRGACALYEGGDEPSQKNIVILLGRFHFGGISYHNLRK